MIHRRSTIEETQFETTIILDEEKIAASPYPKEKVEDYLNRMFAVVGMVRDGDTFKSASFALISAVMVNLYETEWFMKLVKDWVLTEKDGDTIVSQENVFASELLRKKYLNKYGL